MRLSFYQSMFAVATLAGTAFATAIRASDLEQEEASLAQIESGDLVEAQTYNNFAQVEAEVEADSSSESDSSSDSESSSDSSSSSGSDSSSDSASDSDGDALETLELAQQLQELNYLNALGTINAAQVNAMQQMGAMQSMGMQMGGGGQGGMQMAQIGSEEEETPRAKFLAQLTNTLESLDEDQETTIEKMLSQIYEGDTNLVQTEDDNEDSDKHQLAQLANMLADLNDEEFAQVTGKMEEMEEQEDQDLAQEESDDNEMELVQTGVDGEDGRFDAFVTDAVPFLAQAESETIDGLGGEIILAQTKAFDFIDNMTPETRQSYDNMYAQTRNGIYDWLSQIDDMPRAQIGQILSQTRSGNHFMQNIDSGVASEIADFFMQFDAVPYDEEAILAQVTSQALDAQMGEATEKLAQYSAEDILKLNELVEVKRQALNEDEEEDYM